MMGFWNRRESQTQETVRLIRAEQERERAEQEAERQRRYDEAKRSPGKIPCMSYTEDYSSNHMEWKTYRDECETGIDASTPHEHRTMRGKSWQWGHGWGNPFEDADRRQRRYEWVHDPQTDRGNE